jgi:hypothetical protein
MDNCVVKTLIARGKYLKKYDTCLVYEHWSEVRAVLPALLVHIWTAAILVPRLSPAVLNAIPAALFISTRLTTASIQCDGRVHKNCLSFQQLLPLFPE